MIKDKFSGFFCNDAASLAPFVTIDGGEIFPEYRESIGRSDFAYSYVGKDFSDSLYFTEIPSGFTVKRVFRNNSEKPIRLTELGDEMVEKSLAYLMDAIK